VEQKTCPQYGRLPHGGYKILRTPDILRFYTRLISNLYFNSP
jgi:hypothetical protein